MMDVKALVVVNWDIVGFTTLAHAMVIFASSVIALGLAYSYSKELVNVWVEVLSSSGSSRLSRMAAGLRVIFNGFAAVLCAAGAVSACTGLAGISLSLDQLPQIWGAGAIVAVLLIAYAYIRDD